MEVCEMKTLRYIFKCLLGFLCCEFCLFSDIDSHKWESKVETQSHFSGGRFI